MKSSTAFGLNQINLIKKRAHQIEKNYETLYHVNLSPQKKQTLDVLAKYKTDEIEWTIEKNKYQKRLNRTLDKIDTERRLKYESELKRKQQIAKNQLKIQGEKRSRLRQKFNKHFDEVGRRFAESCQSARNKSIQISSSIQKDKQQYFDAKKKEEYQRSLLNTNKPQCFDLAQNFIQKRNSKSREFSQKSLSRLSQKSLKNIQHLKQERKNKLKQIKKSQKSNVQVLKKKELQRQQKQQTFLEMYTKDVQATKKCNLLKNFTTQNRVKKIQQDLKKKYEVWESNKRMIDERRSQIPEKCNNFMEKTLTSKFRSSPSSHRQTSLLWKKNAMRKKQQLSQDHKIQSDMIIKKQHENAESFKTAKKMHIQMESMRHRAAILSLKYF